MVRYVKTENVLTALIIFPIKNASLFLQTVFFFVQLCCFSTSPLRHVIYATQSQFLRQSFIQRIHSTKLTILVDNTRHERRFRADREHSFRARAAVSFYSSGNKGSFAQKEELTINFVSTSVTECWRLLRFLCIASIFVNYNSIHKHLCKLR